MINFDDYLNECLKDEEFKKEWDALEEEYSAKKVLIESKPLIHIPLSTIKTRIVDDPAKK